MGRWPRPSRPHRAPMRPPSRRRPARPDRDPPPSGGPEPRPPRQGGAHRSIRLRPAHTTSPTSVATRSKALCIAPARSENAATMASVITLRTTAYSAIVCPLSRCDVIRCVDIFPSSRFRGELRRDGFDHPLEGCPNAARQRGESRDDSERDDGENDAVLGHRLALLVAERGEPRLRGDEELQHLIHLLSRRDNASGGWDPFGNRSGSIVHAESTSVQRGVAETPLSGFVLAVAKNPVGSSSCGGSEISLKRVTVVYSGADRRNPTMRAKIVTVVRSEGGVVCERCVVAASPLRRLRGLLGRAFLPAGEGILLKPARSVHTFFMRFPLDVGFVDSQLAVVGVAAAPPSRGAG